MTGTQIDILTYNRIAWDRQVETGNKWSLPVDHEVIAAARHGDWCIYLTPMKPVPSDWFPPLFDCNVLCLASGGGQQSPILAVAGARVTVLDNSPKQLAQDRLVAQCEQLDIDTVEGDMAELSMFPDQCFDLIVHPVSNNYVPDVRPVWQEAFRVLRPGGVLLSGFSNPVIYFFPKLVDCGVLRVEYSLPYSDIRRLSDNDKQYYRDQDTPFEISHTLDDQIGGQIAAGFFIRGFYEDYSEVDNDVLKQYMPTYIVTRSSKPMKHSHVRKCCDFSTHEPDDMLSGT